MIRVRMIGTHGSGYPPAERAKFLESYLNYLENNEAGTEVLSVIALDDVVRPRETVFHVVCRVDPEKEKERMDQRRRMQQI